MSTQAHRQNVETLSALHSVRDWETLKNCLAPDVPCEDVPAEEPGAREPGSLG